MLPVAVTMDSQGLVCEWTSLAQQLFGYSRSQALGKSLGDLIVPPEARPFHEAGLRRYAATREAHCLGQRVDIDALHGKGHVVPIQLQITPREVEGKLFFDACIAARKSGHV